MSTNMSIHAHARVCIDVCTHAAVSVCCLCDGRCDVKEQPLSSVGLSSVGLSSACLSTVGLSSAGLGSVGLGSVGLGSAWPVSIAACATAGAM